MLQIDLPPRLVWPANLEGIGWSHARWWTALSVQWFMIGTVTSPHAKELPGLRSDTRRHPDLATCPTTAVANSATYSLLLRILPALPRQRLCSVPQSEISTCFLHPHALTGYPLLSANRRRRALRASVPPLQSRPRCPLSPALHVSNKNSPKLEAGHNVSLVRADMLGSWCLHDDQDVGQVSPETALLDCQAYGRRQLRRSSIFFFEKLGRASLLTAVQSIVPLPRPLAAGHGSASRSPQEQLPRNRRLGRRKRKRHHRNGKHLNPRKNGTKENSLCVRRVPAK